MVVCIPMGRRRQKIFGLYEIEERRYFIMQHGRVNGSQHQICREQ